MSMKELPQAKEIAFMDLVKGSWQPFKDNWVLALVSALILSYLPFLLVALPACVIVFVSMLLVGFINKALMMPICFIEGSFFILLFAAAYNVVRAGWTIILLKLAADKKSSFEDLKGGIPWFINYFYCCLLIGIGTAIGGFLLLVPGIFIAVRTSLAPFLIIDENLGPIEALKRSNELVTGYSWQIFGYYCLMGITNLIFGLTPIQIVLLPASMAFFDIVLARIYLYKKGLDEGLNLLPDYTS